MWCCAFVCRSFLLLLFCVLFAVRGGVSVRTSSRDPKILQRFLAPFPLLQCLQRFLAPFPLLQCLPRQCQIQISSALPLAQAPASPRTLEPSLNSFSRPQDPRCVPPKTRAPQRLHVPTERRLRPLQFFRFLVRFAMEDESVSTMRSVSPKTCLLIDDSLRLVALSRSWILLPMWLHSV